LPWFILISNRTTHKLLEEDNVGGEDVDTGTEAIVGGAQLLKVEMLAQIPEGEDRTTLTVRAPHAVVIEVAEGGVGAQ
jgi:hypothetical protein